ncbi:MAG: NAD(P)/FAD-dependent oxidoreductase [Clostridia bacterium]|nr:NAD(P)/FAD-dependent oxidoreductase [Clostridia bacterium]
MAGTVKVYDSVIIGGGPAGMMAAITLAERGFSVILAEQNKLLGRKLRITGKGRCNITNNCDFRGLTDNLVSGDRFMLSSLKRFSNIDLISYLNEGGLETIEERGGRVFPASGRAYDVAEFFVRRLKELKVPVLYDYKARKLLTGNGIVSGVDGLLNGKPYSLGGRCVILATGGITYRLTGSDGSGYIMARDTGHSIAYPLPSLVGLQCREKALCASLQGLTLKNTAIRLYEANKSVFEDFGELMFTDAGVTGPVVLSLSRFYIERAVSIAAGRDAPAASRRAAGRRAVTADNSELKRYIAFDPAIYDKLNADDRFRIELDLKPALDEVTLSARLSRDLEKYHAKQAANALKDLLPAALTAPVAEMSGIDPHAQVAQLKTADRRALVKTLKHFVLTPLWPEDPDHGIVTQGGISLDEIEPSTLCSKLCRGLFFAGEVLDVDGLTGGYNLTVAFSTGRAAGNGAASYLTK